MIDIAKANFSFVLYLKASVTLNWVLRINLYSYILMFWLSITMRHIMSFFTRQHNWRKKTLHYRRKSADHFWNLYLQYFSTEFCKSISKQNMSMNSYIVIYSSKSNFWFLMKVSYKIIDALELLTVISHSGIEIDKYASSREQNNPVER